MRIEVGSLARTSESVTVEWTIKHILNIFLYTKGNNCFYSPKFSGFNSLWSVRFYPFGQGRKDSGWITLSLVCFSNNVNKDLSYAPKNMNCSVSLKKSDGTFEKVCSNESCVFGGDDLSNQVKLIKISELKKRKSELAPFGSLTVACTLRNNDYLESVSRLITLSENLEDMFVSGKDCDVTLKVQNKEFFVHKSVLACRCPVFETMFSINMKEKDTGVVKIKDCNPNAFRDFLMYIYSGKFTNSSSDVFQLYKIAHKYMIQQLKSDCVFHMTRNLSVENVFDTALLAHQFDENELKTEVQEFFNNHFSDISDSTKWDSFLKSNYAVSNELLKNMGKYMKTSRDLHGPEIGGPARPELDNRPTALARSDQSPTDKPRVYWISPGDRRLHKVVQ